MVRSGTFAAIDVGTTKICTIVGEVAGPGERRILGVGISPSPRLSRGTADGTPLKRRRGPKTPSCRVAKCCGSQAEKDEPQPQVVVAFGFLMTN